MDPNSLPQFLGPCCRKHDFFIFWQVLQRKKNTCLPQFFGLCYRKHDSFFITPSGNKKI